MGSRMESGRSKRVPGIEAGNACGGAVKVITCVNDILSTRPVVGWATGGDEVKSGTGAC